MLECQNHGCNQVLFDELMYNPKNPREVVCLACYGEILDTMKTSYQIIRSDNKNPVSLLCYDKATATKLWRSLTEQKRRNTGYCKPNFYQIREVLT